MYPRTDPANHRRFLQIFAGGKLVHLPFGDLPTSGGLRVAVSLADPCDAALIMDPMPMADPAWLSPLPVQAMTHAPVDEGLSDTPTDPEAVLALRRLKASDHGT